MDVEHYTQNISRLYLNDLTPWSVAVSNSAKSTSKRGSDFMCRSLTRY